MNATPKFGFHSSYLLKTSPQFINVKVNLKCEFSLTKAILAHLSIADFEFSIPEECMPNYQLWTPSITLIFIFQAPNIKSIVTN
jgi:hypothetical protein